MKVISALETFALLAIVLMAYGFAGQMDYEDDMKLACALRDWPVQTDETPDFDPCACLSPDDSQSLHPDSHWFDARQPTSCDSNRPPDGDHHATDTSPRPHHWR